MESSRDIRSLNLSDMAQYIESIGEKAFRARQIYEWVSSGACRFEDFTNLSKELRSRLENDFDIDNVRIVEKHIAKDETLKFLFELPDGNIIESVVMKYFYGYTICISTQVGCKMGCSFCASGLEGMVRNLLPGEMTGQLFAAQRELRKSNGEARISRVVLMGSGEPLDNYDNVIKFIELVTDPQGVGLSQRNITLSTCGIVPKIYELADMDFQITLAVSFHAYRDDIRSELMPINKVYPIEELLKAASYYFKKTKRRVTFEYALIQGKNDDEKGAVRLAKILKGTGIHVNLIPINDVEESGFIPTDDESIRKFQRILQGEGVEATVRRELGSDINAACGQLRKRHVENLL